MKRLSVSLLLVLMTSSVALASNSDKVADRLKRSAEIINEIMGTPERSIPHDLLDKAVCVGIIPSQKKLAFGFGGSYGRGEIVCRRNGNGPWGAPSMIVLRGGSFGFQLGGSATDVVFIVMNAHGAKKLMQSKSELGTDASAAAGPVGRTASAATDIQMSAEILTYSRAKGLFAGVSLKGAALTPDRKANRSLYHRDLDPKDICLYGKVRIPPAARALDRALNKYSPRGGQKITD